MRDDILMIVFIRDILAYMFFFNDFQFLVSHVHIFHIFVAVFLISCLMFMYPIILFIYIKLYI